MARDVKRNVNVKMARSAVVLMATAHVQASGWEFIAIKVRGSTSRPFNYFSRKSKHFTNLWQELKAIALRFLQIKRLNEVEKEIRNY